MWASLGHSDHIGLRIAAAITLSLLLSTGADAEVYKWKDAAGIVHYSQTPPASESFSEVPVAPPSSSADEEAGQLQDLVQHQQDAADREAEDKRTAAEQARQLTERAANCIKARDDLVRLNNGPGQRHMVKESDGSARRLSEEEHRETMTQLQQVITDNCGE